MNKLLALLTLVALATTTTEHSCSVSCFNPAQFETIPDERSLLLVDQAILQSSDSHGRLAAAAAAAEAHGKLPVPKTNFSPRGCPSHSAKSTTTPSTCRSSTCHSRLKNYLPGSVGTSGQQQACGRVQFAATCFVDNLLQRLPTGH